MVNHMDKSIPPFAAHLLDFIGNIEAPRGYDTVFGNNQGKLKKRVTQMTVAEVQAAQGGWSKQFGSSATGRYQFMRKTLQGLIAEQRLDTSAKFDAAMQDRLGLVLLRRRGYDKFVAGKLGLKAFAKSLAQEWASLPVLAATQGGKRKVTRGQSFYAGDGLNKALISPEQFEAALKAKLPGTVDGTAPDVPVVIPPPSVPTVPAPTAPPKRPSIWKLLWNMLFGRGLPAPPAAPVAEKQATAEDQGRARLRNVQEMLAAKGYAEVGQPDGLDGPRTRGAIRVFRAEHGLPAGDQVDDQLVAALAAAGPRQVAKGRAEATADDLRANGNTQVQTLDGMGWLAKALGLGGIIGGINESGILGKATDTLQSAQDTLGTVTTVLTTVIGVVQWCVGHWWIFAIGGAVWVAYRIAHAILNLVVLFRQGVLARADR